MIFVISAPSVPIGSRLAIPLPCNEESEYVLFSISPRIPKFVKETGLR